MSYINVDECLSKIDENRINRYKYANVYAGADADTMTIGFAYSAKREDEFSVVRFDEFNSMGMDYSMEDTIQAVMTVYTESDVNKNLFFYEDLLLEKEDKADGQHGCN